MSDPEGYRFLPHAPECQCEGCRAAGGDRGDNTAWCEVVHACPPGTSGFTPCCNRTPFELPRTDRMTVDPALVTCVPAADRQTDEERCRCRNLADEDMPPAERIGDAEAKRCGLWSAQGCALHAARPAVADAVMADLGAAITEGVTEVRLREAVAQWLGNRANGEGWWERAEPLREGWRHDADDLLALPEMRALLDAAAKVQRIENLRRLRAALGGEG